MNGPDHLDALRGFKLNALRQTWRARFGDDAPAFRSRDLLSRAYAYRLQVETFGDMKTQVKKRMTELADRFAADPNFDPAPRMAPRPGSALVREWNGVRHIVLVTKEGFQYRDRTYGSLSQVAKAISGAHWSGPRFFGLIGDGLSAEP